MVKNSLKPQTAANSGIIEYEAGGDKIKLTPAIVKKYLISGDASNITDQEVMMFMSLCRYSHLNPWTREAYCIKYGNQAATMVVGKAAFQKRAEENPNFDGMESGVITLDEESGDIEYRRGAMAMPGEKIIGGWADVYRKDRSHPTHVEVGFDEYAGKKKDGSLTTMWATKPAVMIRKVAMVTALRDAFPAALEGMYIAEEYGGAETAANTAPVTREEVERIEANEDLTPTETQSDSLDGNKEEPIFQ